MTEAHRLLLTLIDVGTKCGHHDDGVEAGISAGWGALDRVGGFVCAPAYFE